MANILFLVAIPGINFGTESPQDVSVTLQLLLLLTILSLAPGILIMLTSFTLNHYCLVFCSDRFRDTIHAAEPSVSRTSIIPHFFHHVANFCRD